LLVIVDIKIKHCGLVARNILYFTFSRTKYWSAVTNFKTKIHIILLHKKTNPWIRSH